MNPASPTDQQGIALFPSLLDTYFKPAPHFRRTWGDLRLPADAELCLQLVEGEDSVPVRRVPLFVGSTIPVGRATSSGTKQDSVAAPTNVLLKNPVISRRHAHFVFEDSNMNSRLPDPCLRSVYQEAELIVQDLGSCHGTFVNGVPLQNKKHYVKSGDKIQFGNRVIRGDGEHSTFDPDGSLANRVAEDFRPPVFSAQVNNLISESSVSEVDSKAPRGAQYTLASHESDESDCSLDQSDEDSDFIRPFPSTSRRTTPSHMVPSSVDNAPGAHKYGGRFSLTIGDGRGTPFMLSSEIDDEDDVYSEPTFIPQSGQHTEALEPEYSDGDHNEELDEDSDQSEGEDNDENSEDDEAGVMAEEALEQSDEEEEKLPSYDPGLPRAYGHPRTQERVDERFNISVAPQLWAQLDPMLALQAFRPSSTMGNQTMPSPLLSDFHIMENTPGPDAFAFPTTYDHVPESSQPMAKANTFHAPPPVISVPLADEPTIVHEKPMSKGHMSIDSLINPPSVEPDVYEAAPVLSKKRKAEEISDDEEVEKITPEASEESVASTDLAPKQVTEQAPEDVTSNSAVEITAVSTISVRHLDSGTEPSRKRARLTFAAGALTGTVAGGFGMLAILASLPAGFFA
ncbi:hypothetical protein EJ06DRAFT_562866 [Trichodelitschia bisporula]|uniref:FHA domain-containing protein n=1 Tax=Trichodelitschia bisporula TaxID=703511 RepID=A0A6G1HUG5_9PEZI|nr:hypothetical protein EJ06DRAFT_562866 [Trichodelitschia bisporula]